MDIPQIDAAWSAEKSQNIITGACLLLEGLNPDNKFKAHIESILVDSTKVFCTSMGAFHKDKENRWSPELAAYLMQNPSKCAEALEIVGSESYRDGFYDFCGNNF